MMGSARSQLSHPKDGMQVAVHSTIGIVIQHCKERGLCCLLLVHMMVTCNSEDNSIAGTAHTDAYSNARRHKSPSPAKIAGAVRRQCRQLQMLNKAGNPSSD